MTWYRKNPLFAAALALCALVALGEAWCIYERWAASRESAVKLERKRAELAGMSEVTPPPTRAVAVAIEADLARAKQALAAMQAGLKGRGPAAERLHAAKVPAARTDAYFDLATFVERTRDQARKLAIDVRPEAARFGFAAYANEGPDTDHIEPVFRQRQVAQYLIESLFEAHPRALLAVKRERPLTKAERDARNAAAAALASGGTAEPPPEAPAETAEEGADYFDLDPRASVRAPLYLDATAFRLVFVGQTAVLRAFLNHLSSFDLPVLVREVEVEPATADDLVAPVPAEEVPAAETTAAPAASIVLTAEPPAPPTAAKKAAARPAVAPMVAKPFSKFTVTVEFIELAPPPAPAGEAAAPAAPGT